VPIKSLKLTLFRPNPRKRSKSWKKLYLDGTSIKTCLLFSQQRIHISSGMFGILPLWWGSHCMSLLIYVCWLIATAFNVLL